MTSGWDWPARYRPRRTRWSAPLSTAAPIARRVIPASRSVAVVHTMRGPSEAGARDAIDSRCRTRAPVQGARGETVDISSGWRLSSRRRRAPRHPRPRGALAHGVTGPNSGDSAAPAPHVARRHRVRNSGGTGHQRRISPRSRCEPVISPEFGTRGVELRVPALQPEGGRCGGHCPGPRRLPVRPARHDDVARRRGVRNSGGMRRQRRITPRSRCEPGISPEFGTSPGRYRRLAGRPGADPPEALGRGSRYGRGRKPASSSAMARSTSAGSAVGVPSPGWGP